MQWLPVCAGILLFICSTRADAVCSVPDDKKALVSALELDLAHTVAPCIAPDPSVLLALNLGKNFNTKAIKMLKEQLVEDAVKKVSQGLTFTSGKVALYVLALRSSCFDPTNLPCSSGKINLVQILKRKTQEEITNIKKKGSPLTTYYQVSLDVLALCVMSSPEAFPAGEALAKYIPKDPGVDTAAVAVMACTCVLGMDSLPSKTMEALKLTLSQLISLILKAQTPDGTIGNIYSTGLAGQALTAAQAYYPKEEWKCSSTMDKVLSEIPKDTFSLPGPASQVLPFLQGKSYVSVKGMQCAHVPSITVEFTILNDLTGENFKYSIEVSVPEGSTLLQVMEKAAEINPKEFSFTTEQSSFGAYVTSINHLSGSTNERTYWQYFSGHVPLDKGVSTYIPVNAEHILAIFSKY